MSMATVQAVIERTAVAWGLAKQQAGRTDRLEVVTPWLPREMRRERERTSCADDDEELIELIG